MTEKPHYASDYTSEQARLVTATCLYVATKIGDLMDDVVIIGGLVPSLIIDQQHLSAGTEPHVGTLDLDIGLSLAVIDEGRYSEISDRLRAAGFTMDTNEQGNRTRQR